MYLTSTQAKAVQLRHAAPNLQEKTSVMFDFQKGDVIRHRSLPWSIRLEGPSSYDRPPYHGVPIDSNALVLDVQSRINSLGHLSDGGEEYRITMCVDGQVGWSHERSHQWTKHWELVARSEE